MSEQEFENWLSLLTGLLQLTPEQRDNISDELRSHLEERMEDLLESGSSREEAIAAALEDFGDTAALAHHFTNIAHHHRRRRLMRYTYGTIAAMTCSILVLATFWPGSQPPLTSQTVAQSGNNNPTAADSAIPLDPAGKFDEGENLGLVENPFQGSKEAIEAKLSQPLPALDYFQVPFDQILVELSDRLGVTFYIDPAALDDFGITREELSENLMTLHFPENAISAKTLLEYAMKSLGTGNVWGYTIRDNIVAITLKEDTFETVIYKCRDLMIWPEGFGAMEIDRNGIVPVQFGGGGHGAAPPGMGMMGGGRSQSTQLPDQQLIDVITSTIEPGSWSWLNPEVGIGSITTLNGLIIVKHTREVQDQVKDLLQKLREAMKE